VTTDVRPDRLTSRRGRVLGVDAARAVALVGMFATHILPLSARSGGGGGETLTGLLADGRSSALFAVLAGVGVALASGGTEPPPDGRTHLAAAASLLVRGALVALLGLWLVGLDAPVAVILAYYGLLFVVAVPLLRLRSPVLAAGAVLACVLTPVLSQLLRDGLPAGPGDQADLRSLAEPVELVATLGLTGYYPVLTWTTYLLTGMAVGRLDLRRTDVAAGLLAGGTVLAVAAWAASALLLGPGGGAAALGPALERRRYGTTPTDTWWWLAVDSPHSGSPLDLAHTTGTALAVLGAMLLLTHPAGSASSSGCRPRVLAKVARPLVIVPAALGAAPLTLYTLHVIGLAAHPGNGTDDVALWVTHVLIATAIGALLWLAGHRGPLEAVVSAAGRGARWLVSPPAAPPEGRTPGTGPARTS
jgi:uncharacterized membrane protein